MTIPSNRKGARGGKRVRECEDCGEEVKGRRFRCRDCKKLVCSWCSGHAHRCRK